MKTNRSVSNIIAVAAGLGMAAYALYELGMPYLTLAVGLMVAIMAFGSGLPPHDA